MKRIHTTALTIASAIFIALMLCMPVFASNPADTYGYSPRGMALGNAMTAIVNDWSSVWYNPAGLGKTRHSIKAAGLETDLTLKKRKKHQRHQRIITQLSLHLHHFIPCPPKALPALLNCRRMRP